MTWFPRVAGWVCVAHGVVYVLIAPVSMALLGPAEAMLDLAVGVFALVMAAYWFDEAK